MKIIQKKNKPPPSPPPTSLTSPHLPPSPPSDDAAQKCMLHVRFIDNTADMSKMHQPTAMCHCDLKYHMAVPALKGTFLVRPGLSLAGCMVISAAVAGGSCKHMALDGNQLQSRSLEVSSSSSLSVPSTCLALKRLCGACMLQSSPTSVLAALKALSRCLQIFWLNSVCLYLKRCTAADCLCPNCS